MTRVKICGITNTEDALCAAEAGADFLGFILYPGSPRYVSVDVVASITQVLRAAFGVNAPRCVGVFVDVSVDAVREAIARSGLDLAQLHGNESPDVITALRACVFKAIRPRTLDEAAAAYRSYGSAVPQLPDHPQLLVDAYHPHYAGGTGEHADVTVARWLAQQCPILLAGGLTPDNVADAIASVRPWGVDVSSGVEATKGRKDHGRIRAFVQAVHSNTDDHGADQ